MPDIRQHGNVVGGDQAAGDITKVVHVPRGPTTASGLYERLQNEMATDSPTRALIARLQHYTNSQAEDPLGLDAKLTAGNRAHWQAEASHLKEQFAKRLFEHNLSPVAQQILLYALTQVHLFFRTHVKPLIEAGASDQEIRTALTDSVILTVLERLEDNVLNLMPDEIEGIVWFLTGNCFINWTPRA